MVYGNIDGRDRRAEHTTRVLRRDRVCEAGYVVLEVNIAQVDVELVLLSKQRYAVAEAKGFVLLEFGPVDAVEAREVTVIRGVEADLAMLATGLLMLIQTFIAVLDALVWLRTQLVIFQTIITLITVALT